MKRKKTNKIIIHCSDSDIKSHDNIETIRSWHTQRGFTGPDGVSGTFDDIGYHFFITKEGSIFKGRDVEVVGAHTKNHNHDSVSICLSGRNGLPTDAQNKKLSDVCKELCRMYDLSKGDIYGHHYFDKGKTCPNFDVSEIASKWNWN